MLRIGNSLRKFWGRLKLGACHMAPNGGPCSLEVDGCLNTVNELRRNRYGACLHQTEAPCLGGT